MKILLVKPCWPYPVGKNDLIHNRIWPPLSLANCAALLEKDGHQVTILDAHMKRLSPLKVSVLADGFDKVFITSSSLDRWECPNLDLEPFIETTKKIRKNTEELYVMGYHGTVKPEEILMITRSKAIIRGEPEMTVVRICRKCNLSSIDGITYVNEDKIISNPDRAPLNLELLPIPAFHLLQMDKYSFELLGDRFVLLETSRGCRYSCTFCYQGLYGEVMRQKSIGQIIGELEAAIECHGARNGYFIDLDFGRSPELIMAICEFLTTKKYNFKWTCQMRADDTNRVLLQAMARAGCQLIHFGVEGGSQEKVKCYNKKLLLGQVTKAVNCAHESGMQTACSFLFDYIVQSGKDIKEDIDFAKKLNPTYASFHVIYPFKGTREYDKSDADIQERFSNFFCKDWFSKKQKKLIRNAYVQFYLRIHYFISRFKAKDSGNLFKKLRLFFSLLTR